MNEGLDTRVGILLMFQAVSWAVGWSRVACIWGFGSLVWPVPAFLGRQNEAMWCWEPLVGMVGRAAVLSCPLAAEDNMVRKGADKRTTQSRSIKTNHYFRKEKKEKQALQHFQSPKLNISMETIAAGGLLSVSLCDLLGLTRFNNCLSFPHISYLGSSQDRLLCITSARLNPAFLVSGSPLMLSSLWRICSHLSCAVFDLQRFISFTLWHVLIMSCPIYATPVTLCSLKDGCDFVLGRGPLGSVVHLSAL